MDVLDATLAIARSYYRVARFFLRQANSTNNLLILLLLLKVQSLEVSACILSVAFTLLDNCGNQPLSTRIDVYFCIPALSNLSLLVLRHYGKVVIGQSSVAYKIIRG